jgi:hypothetical protein
MTGGGVITHRKGRAQADTYGGFLPTDAQLLFLKACILEPTEALASWQQWRATNASVGSLDDACTPLIPQLYCNLRAASYQGPEMEWAEAAYLRNLPFYQGLVDALIPVLQRFNSFGIPVILFKGIAVSTLWYPDPQVRVMTDLDLLVPVAEGDTAMALLNDMGWSRNLPLNPRNRDIFQRCSFSNDRGQMLDLHWHLFKGAGHDDDAMVWPRAMPISIGSEETLTLSVSDHFLHCCAHGYGWSKKRHIRWIADAYMIYHHAENKIDWLYIVEQAKNRHLSLRLCKALEFLGHVGLVQVPHETLEALRAIPAPRWEQAELAFIAPVQCPRRSLRHISERRLKRAWYKHRRLCAQQSLTFCIMTFPAMASREMRLTSIWALPLGVMRTIKKIALDLKRH